MNLIYLTLINHLDQGRRSMYYDLLDKFRAEGHNVFVCMPLERRSKGRTGLSEKFGIHFLKIRTLNIQKTTFLEKGLGSILIEYQYQWAIRKYLGDISFDVVLYSTPPITFTMVIRRLRAKYNALSYLLLKDIFPQNAVDLDILSKSGLLYRYFRRKEKDLYRISDFIGCMTAANRAYILRHNPEIHPSKVEINPNSVNLQNLLQDRTSEEVRTMYGLPTNKLIFIYGGNLGKPQGVDFIIDVLKSNRQNEDVYFLIIGDGTEYGHLSNAVRDINACNIRLLEKMAKEEYDRVVSSCDVGLVFLDHRFTIPNFPSRLLTYLEYELPVLAATDEATDLKEVIEDNRIGYWCRSGDLATFNQCVKLLTAPDAALKEMGRRCKELLATSYDVSHSYQLVVDKLSEITAEI